MWCPNCKTEYVNGVTRCSDCGVALVNELTKAVDFSELSEETKEKLAHMKAREESRETIHPKEGSNRYIDKRSQYEDMKSSAYTFLIVGVLGFFALILIACDVIPLNMASYMKIIMYLVMGVLFFIFLLIGIKSFAKMKHLSNDAAEEEKTTEEILFWFFSNHTKESMDASFASVAGLPEEQLYFKRCEVISGILSSRFPELAQNYTEDLIEKIYTRLFSEN